MLAVPGALKAALGYYRAMFDAARADPDLAEVPQAAGRPIVVPTLALCGAQDKRAEVLHDQARHFTGPYRFELVPGASHFLQREQPQAVTELVLDWFARNRGCRITLGAELGLNAVAWVVSGLMRGRVAGQGRPAGRGSGPAMGLRGWGRGPGAGRGGRGWP
jgi:hypothetical protein